MHGLQRHGIPGITVITHHFLVACRFQGIFRLVKTGYYLGK